MSRAPATAETIQSVADRLDNALAVARKLGADVEVVSPAQLLRLAGECKYASERMAGAASKLRRAARKMQKSTTGEKTCTSDA